MIAEKKVILTGATGFVGRHVLNQLLLDGYKVYCIGRSSVKLINSNVHFFELDFHDSNLVDKLEIIFKECEAEYLIHLAWFVEPNKFWTSSENVFWLSRSFILLEQFVKHNGKRVLMSGSCAEYTTSNDLLNEYTSERNPTTIYGIAKNALFELASNFSKLNTIDFVWARLFYMYGNGEPKQKFVSSIVTALKNDEEVICQNPELERDYMYIKDVANAFVKILSSQYSGPINVASGDKIKLGDLVIKLGNYFGKPHLVKLNTTIQQSNSIVASTEVLNSTIGWTPYFNFDRSFKDYIKT